jgi:hypothetical protein
MSQLTATTRPSTNFRTGSPRHDIADQSGNLPPAVFNDVIPAPSDDQPPLQVVDHGNSQIAAPGYPPSATEFNSTSKPVRAQHRQIAANIPMGIAIDTLTERLLRRIRTEQSIAQFRLRANDVE